MHDRLPHAGFKPHNRHSPVTEPWEPIYSKHFAQETRLGLWLAEPHCNSRGFLHGGVIAALIDNAMGLSCARAIVHDGQEVAGLVTINLSIEYMGMAKIGQWLELQTSFVKIGRSICFSVGQAMAEDEVIATASASFKRIH